MSLNIRRVVLVLGLIVGPMTEAAGQAVVVPDNPPRAALIHVSAPDGNDNVIVTGSAGAVPGGSGVAVVTLDTGHLGVTQAAADGSFSISTFGPPGSSLLVKADPTNRFINVNQRTPEPADIYLGLLHPDGTFDSLVFQGSDVTLVSTGTTPTAIAQNAALPFDFSAPVATRSWTPADPLGTYVAFGVRVRPGQSPFDQANWLSLGFVRVMLSP